MFNVETFVVPTWAMPAIINNDFSGLEPGDEAKIRRFLQETEAALGHGHFSYDPEAYCTFFSRNNDVHSLSDECLSVDYCYRVEQAPMSMTG